MKATTVKVDGELLREIEEAKPADQSLTAFVREVLRREIDRRKLQQAALQYRAFVEAHHEERTWLEEWDRADLITAPAPERTGE
jgi:hypothetical protein